MNRFSMELEARFSEVFILLLAPSAGLPLYKGTYRKT